jgi:hypothetical protein
MNIKETSYYINNLNNKIINKSIFDFIFSFQKINKDIFLEKYTFIDNNNILHNIILKINNNNFIIYFNNKIIKIINLFNLEFNIKSLILNENINNLKLNDFYYFFLYFYSLNEFNNNIFYLYIYKYLLNLYNINLKLYNINFVIKNRLNLN